MAKSNAERLREFKARQKDKEREASLAVADVFVDPFFLYDSAAMYDFAECLRINGIVPPKFGDDKGPDAFIIYETNELEKPDYNFGSAHNSLGRAELMIAGLADAARYLAEAVNEFKQKEIYTRLQDLEMVDLSTPEAKKAALKEAARLNKMLDQLDKQVRWTFPQWKVTG